MKNGRLSEMFGVPMHVVYIITAFRVMIVVEIRGSGIVVAGVVGLIKAVIVVVVIITLVIITLVIVTMVASGLHG